MHYYEHHIGDYAKDTGHLSLTEHGAYRRLLDWSYASEQALPADLAKVCRIAGASSKIEKAAVKRVMEEFFPLESTTPGESGRRNKRVVEEIQRFRDKSEKARGSVAQRWQRDRYTNVSANVIRPPNGVSSEVIQRARAIHKPITNNQDPFPSDSPKGEEQGAGGGAGTGVEEAPTVVPEQWAVDWAEKMREAGADYTGEEARAAWREYHATRLGDGTWRHKVVGRTPVADWRIALEHQVQFNRAQRAGGSDVEGVTARRIRLENELEWLRKAIGEHVANRSSAAFSPSHSEAARADLEEKKARKKAVERELCPSEKRSNPAPKD